MFFVLFLHNSGTDPSFKLVTVLPSVAPHTSDPTKISLSCLVLFYGVWYLGTFSIWFQKISWSLSISDFESFFNFGFSGFTKHYGIWEFWAINILGLRHMSITHFHLHICHSGILVVFTVWVITKLHSCLGSCSSPYCCLHLVCLELLYGSMPMITQPHGWCSRGILHRT